MWMQVTEFTANELGEKFEFEHRGTVFVKGKGDMNTYLLVHKKDGASWDWTVCTVQHAQRHLRLVWLSAWHSLFVTCNTWLNASVGWWIEVTYQFVVDDDHVVVFWHVCQSIP